MAVIANSYEDLMKQLTSRVVTKSASTTATKVATGDSAPGITDPRDKGTVAIPKDPDATNTVMKLPATGMNDSVTPVTAPPAVAKTVDGPEKVATIQKKAQKVAADMAALRKTLSTKAATAAEITPNMPTDCVNKDSNPAPSTDNGPKNKGVPDPEANKDAAPKGDKGVAGPADPAAKSVSMPTPDSKGEIPDNGENTNDKSANLLDFDPVFHFKVASLILSTEEGKAFAQQLIEQHHGALEAESLIKAASVMEQMAAEMEQVEAEGENAAAQLWDAASPDEKESILKLAYLHASVKSTLATDMEKQAYDDGAAAAATQQEDPMAGAGAGGPTGGAAPGGDPAAGGEISDEDIMQVLQQLVQSGEIKPEEAQAILQALQQGDAGGAPGGDPAAGGAPDPTAGAGGPPMAEPPADAAPEDKMAFTTFKSASAAVDAILAGMK